MEWHGEKMLPRGIPQLVYQVTPDWILRDLKVIVLSKKEKEPAHVLGYVRKENSQWYVRLFPTRLINDANTVAQNCVQSVAYWVVFLSTTLHEIGHIFHTSSLLNDYHCRPWYYENLADRYRYQIMAKIMARDPRLGQPHGWIGGLPGIYLLRESKWARQEGRYDWRCLENLRAYKCEGQLSIRGVVHEICHWGPLTLYRNGLWRKLKNFRSLTPDLGIAVRVPIKGSDNCHYNILKDESRPLVKFVAEQSGIGRHHVDSAGRRHLFFNFAEAGQLLEKFCDSVDVLESIMRKKKKGRRKWFYRMLEIENRKREQEVGPSELDLEPIPF